MQTTDIRLERSLKAIDDALGLMLLGEQWAVTYRWPQSDPRWARVQSGDCSPESAFDILTYLPFDCSPEEAGSYVEKTCSEWARLGRIDVARVLDRVHAHNEKQQEANLEPLVEYTEEMVKTNFPTLFPGSGVVKPVFQYNPLTKRK
jgi:hypothetical protein